jgi:hypothetical protein
MLETANDLTPNVKAPSYFIVKSHERCPQCKSVTAVFALALPDGYESYVENDEGGEWEKPGRSTVLSYVEFLPETIAHRVRAMSENYRLDSQGEQTSRIWLNHCGHCGTQLEEEELHGELDGAFGAIPRKGFEVIHLEYVHEPFEAWAGCETHYVVPLAS